MISTDLSRSGHPLFPRQVPAGVTASVSCDIAGYTVSGGCPANDQVQLSAFGPATASACNANVSPWSPSAYSSVAGSETIVIKYTLPNYDIVSGSNARTATCTVTVSFTRQRECHKL